VLSDQDRRALIELAWSAVRARVWGVEMRPLAPEGSLALPAGAFVTLRQGVELRGCIGCTDSEEPLALAVARCAAAAASDDPRFLPVTEAELELLRIEVSVLGPLEPVTDPAEIEVGRHGLLVEHGHRRGLLLPQVPLEWGWDLETFLEQVCLKAGLTRGAWRAQARIFRFEAEVFGE